jgi:isopenicillin N synthase-like dioxygenase
MSVVTIDISPFVTPSTASEDARAAVLAQIRAACLDCGFFVITGHGVPRDLQIAALTWASRFFDLPLEEKLELSEKKSWGRSFRGYQIIGGEAYEQGKLPDLKEVSVLAQLQMP